jgi:tRNA A22 N-methylase
MRGVRVLYAIYAMVHLTVYVEKNMAADICTIHTYLTCRSVELAKVLTTVINRRVNLRVNLKSANHLRRLKHLKQWGKR